MLARTLEAEGYGVAWPPTAGSALVEIERAAPDLVLLDVTMPGLDGLGVTRRLRGKGDALPVLLLTARDARRRSRGRPRLRAQTTTSSSPSRRMSCSRACERCCAAADAAAIS